MATKKGKLRPPPSDMTVFRSVSLRAEDVNNEDRSIGVTLATESPVRVYDYQRGRVVDEVLVMSGGDIPRQLPLLDSHSRWSVGDIRGSIRDLKVEGDALLGRAYFASNEESQHSYELARDGHLTDVSIGFRPSEVRFLEDGERWKYKGRDYLGPLRVVTKWRAFEGSLVPVGADPNAKLSPAHRAYLDPDGARSEAMDEAFRNWLVSKGMDAKLSDEEALRWADEHLNKVQEKLEERKAAEAAEPAKKLTEDLTADVVARALEKIEEQRKLRDEYEGSIVKMCRRAGLENADDYARTLIGENVKIHDAADKILEKQEQQRQPAGLPIEPNGSRAESFRKVTLEAFESRVTGKAWTPPKGCENFRNFRMMDLAKRCLDESGVNTRSLDEREILRQAFASMSTRASDGQAFHTTGNFANLLLDATNKSLLMSFENTPSTYQLWTRNAGTVEDFKNINRVRLSEIANQPMVPENGDYKDMTLSDAKETYKVEKHGSIVSLTWETLINDDLGAFNRLVQLQGSAMRRTINKSVYDLLFSNPALSDGVALFHSSSHGANLVTTDLANTALNAAYTVMMTQTGISSDVILGIMPQYLIVSASDSATAEQLLGSYADPAAGGSAAGNSNSLNIYGPQGNRKLTLIIEPLIDGNDADSWYLAANPMVCDTFEVAYLRGEETPVFEQETAFIQDAVKYKVRQTWGVGVIDYRGMVKSSGAG